MDKDTLAKKRNLIINELRREEGFSWNKPGFVYIMQAEESISKIGKSVNDPGIRVKEVNRGYWHEVRLIYVATVKNVSSVEGKLHQLFSDFRMRGEWFSLSPMQIYEHSFDNRFVPWEKYDPYFDYKQIACDWHQAEQERNRRLMEEDERELAMQKRLA